MTTPIHLSAQTRSVFSFPPDYDHPFDARSILVEDLLKYIANRLNHSEELLAEGVPCELLQPGAEGWAKGTIKLSFDFCPEEEDRKSSQLLSEESLGESPASESNPGLDNTESALDYIRRMGTDHENEAINLEC